MKRLLGCLFGALLCIPSWALVDMKNANYSESWTDLTVPGAGFELRIQRTYNSRTLYSGIFGFGWCSDYESKLDITPEGNLKLTECGAGLELDYIPKSFDPKNVDQSVKTILAEVRKKNKTLGDKYFADLEKDLKASPSLREALGSRLDIRGKIKPGTAYYSEGRINEKIVLRNNYYERTLGDGTSERYDLQGKLTHMYDKNGNYLKATYNGANLVSVTDNNGRKLNFKYDAVTKKVSEISGPSGLIAKYKTKGEDLIEVTNAWKSTYKYSYDDLHNLVRVDFPDKTFNLLTYNKDKDWVTSFKDRTGCAESYGYHSNKDNPQNHYWSTVEKKCQGKVTNTSKYEFFHRDRPDGLGKYLYRTRSEVNGEISDIVYHEVFGKPLTILDNSRKTDYSYYPNGLVKTKSEEFRKMEFAYSAPCNKLSALTTVYSSPPVKGKKPETRTVRAQFTYDPKKCNLTLARSSDGQIIKLRYDVRGRISAIEDQSKKIVTITYDERLGKPATVTRQGLGAIKVSYKSNGEIDKIESPEGPQVAIQVASIFNNLLDLIAPATAEAAI